MHTFSGHKDSVFSAVYNKNENQILSCSADNTIKIWNIASAKCLRTFSGHKNSVFSAVYNKDENQILSRSADNTIKIWNIASAKCLRTFFGHKNSVFSAVYNKDETRILSYSDDNTIKIWNNGYLEMLDTLGKFSSSLTSVYFTHLSMTLIKQLKKAIELVCFYESNPAKAFSLIGENIIDRLPANVANIVIQQCLTIEPFRRYIGTLIEKIQLFSNHYTKAKEKIEKLTLIEDAQFIIERLIWLIYPFDNIDESKTESEIIKDFILDCFHNQNTKMFCVKQLDSVKSIGFSSNGHLLLYKDKNLCIFNATKDLTDNLTPIPYIKLVKDDVIDSYTPCIYSSQLIFVDNEGRISLSDKRLENLKFRIPDTLILHKRLLECFKKVKKIIISPDELRAAFFTKSPDNAVYVFNFKGEEDFLYKDPRIKVKSLVFANDSRMLALTIFFSKFKKTTLCLFDTESERLDLCYFNDLTNVCRFQSFDTLTEYCDHCSDYFYFQENQKNIPQRGETLEIPTSSLAFTHDDRQLFVSNLVIDLETRNFRKFCDVIPKSIAISPDDSTIACLGIDNVLYKFEKESYSQLLQRCDVAFRKIAESSN